MTLQELTQLVALGEGRHLEFKRRVPEPHRVSKEVIAFANSAGGTLLLGIEDDGTILGVKDAEEEEFALKRALTRHCNPHVPFSLERVPISRKRDVIAVQVPRSAERPHYLVREVPSPLRRAYVRVEDMSIEASREVIRVMKADKTPNDVRFEFGEKELKLMRYLDTYGRITVEQFANLAGVPRRNASQTLVLMARAKVLHLHADRTQDYFTLGYGVGDGQQV